MNEIFSRRHLPHLYFNEGIYFVTYRLADSLPSKKYELTNNVSRQWDFQKFKEHFNDYDLLLDKASFGSNYLRIKNIADICASSILHYNNSELKVICYCVMSNHIHLLFKLMPENRGISKLMQSIKGYSSRECNKELKRKGTFWQNESYDRWLRDENEYRYTINYILNNPVKAGIITDWKDWKYTWYNKEFLDIP